MQIHQENIFRYLLACFVVALFGLVVAWQNVEKSHSVSMSSRTDASQAPPTVAGDPPPTFEHQ